MTELEAMIKTLGYIGYAVIPRAELAAAQALNAELARLTSAQTREIERLRNEVDFMLHEVGKPSKYETDGTNSGTMCLDYELK